MPLKDTRACSSYNMQNSGKGGIIPFKKKKRSEFVL